MTEPATDPAQMVRVVRALCRLREKAKAEGRHDMTHERRCARLVLQGVLTMGEAQDALAILHAAIKGEADVDAIRLESASLLLSRAIENEHVARYVFERRLREACDTLLRERRPSQDILHHMRSLNAEMGRPFVWPELCEIVARQIQRYFREAQAMRRQGMRGGAHA
jgi:hypothetical protein